MSLNMETDFDKEKDSWVFFPKGDLDIYNSKEFKNEVIENFNKENKDILIDGKDLDYLDSTGLGALISVLKTVKDTDYKIYLENIKPNIRKLFYITELDKLFVIRGEKDE